MRFKAYRISLIGVIILVIIACILAFNYNNKNKLENNNAVNATEFMYYLKEYDSKIGVYKANQTLPFMTIEVYVKTLPSVDQQELKSGIMVQNDEKLKMIIEDYES